MTRRSLRYLGASTTNALNPYLVAAQKIRLLRHNHNVDLRWDDVGKGGVDKYDEIVDPGSRLISSMDPQTPPEEGGGGSTPGSWDQTSITGDDGDEGRKATGPPVPDLSCVIEDEDEEGQRSDESGRKSPQTPDSLGSLKCFHDQNEEEINDIIAKKKTKTILREYKRAVAGKSSRHMATVLLKLRKSKKKADAGNGPVDAGNGPVEEADPTATVMAVGVASSESTSTAAVTDVARGMLRESIGLHEQQVEKRIEAENAQKYATEALERAHRTFQTELQSAVEGERTEGRIDTFALERQLKNKDRELEATTKKLTNAKQEGEQRERVQAEALATQKAQLAALEQELEAANRRSEQQKIEYEKKLREARAEGEQRERAQAEAAKEAQLRDCETKVRAQAAAAAREVAQKAVIAAVKQEVEATTKELTNAKQEGEQRERVQAEALATQKAQLAALEQELEAANKRSEQQKIEYEKKLREARAEEERRERAQAEAAKEAQLRDCETKAHAQAAAAAREVAQKAVIAALKQELEATTKELTNAKQEGEQRERAQAEALATQKAQLAALEQELEADAKELANVKQELEKEYEKKLQEARRDCETDALKYTNEAMSVLRQRVEDAEKENSELTAKLATAIAKQAALTASQQERQVPRNLLFGADSLRGNLASPLPRTTTSSSTASTPPRSAAGLDDICYSNGDGSCDSPCGDPCNISGDGDLSISSSSKVDADEEAPDDDLAVMSISSSSKVDADEEAPDDDLSVSNSTKVGVDKETRGPPEPGTEPESESEPEPDQCYVKKDIKKKAQLFTMNKHNKPVYLGVYMKAGPRGFVPDSTPKDMQMALRTIADSNKRFKVLNVDCPSCDKMFSVRDRVFNNLLSTGQCSAVQFHSKRFPWVDKLKQIPKNTSKGGWSGSHSAIESIKKHKDDCQLKRDLILAEELAEQEK